MSLDLKRNTTINILKSYSIFGVVFIHAGNLLHSDSISYQLFSNIFRIGVPIFLAIWAYYLHSSMKNKSKTESNRYLKKRFFKTTKLFIIWSMVYFLVIWQGKLQGFSIFQIISKCFLGYGWSGQYFFIILLQLILLYPLIKFTFEKKLALPITIMVLIIYLIFNYTLLLPANSFIYKISDRLFFFWLPYVYLGFYLVDNKIQVRLPLLLVLSPIIIFLEYKLRQLILLSAKSPYILFSVLFASSGQVVYAFSKNNIYNSKVRGLSSYIGGNTMTIFILNPLVIFFVDKFITKMNINSSNTMIQNFSPFLITIFVFVICLLLVEFIRKIKLNGVIN